MKFSTLRIESYDELIRNEAELLQRIKKQFPLNGGSLFIAHPFMLLDDIDVILTDEVRNQILQIHKGIKREFSPARYKILKASNSRPKVNINLKGLFRKSPIKEPKPTTEKLEGAQPKMKEEKAEEPKIPLKTPLPPEKASVTAHKPSPTPTTPTPAAPTQTSRRPSPGPTTPTPAATQPTTPSPTPMKEIRKPVSHPSPTSSQPTSSPDQMKRGQTTRTTPTAERIAQAKKATTLRQKEVRALRSEMPQNPPQHQQRPPDRAQSLKTPRDQEKLVSEEEKSKGSSVKNKLSGLGSSIKSKLTRKGADQE